MDHSIPNQALAAATDILADPSLKTRIVGPRPSSARALTTLAMILALSIAAPYAILEMADKASIFDEIEAITEGPKTIESVYVQGQAPAPLHPLAQVGQGEDGRLNVPRMLSAWAHAGLNEHSAKIMLVTLYGRGPTFNGAQGSPMDVARYDHLSDKEITGLFIELGGDTTRVQPGPMPRWPGALDVWKMLIEHEGFEAQLPAASTYDTTLAQAQAAMVLAVQEAGLASVTLPLSTQANPDRMIAYANAIRALNQDLGEVTGWGGQALGLAGRINLSLTTPSMRVEGQTWQDNDQVMIATKWSAISHEWLHAVDWTLSSHAFVNPSNRRTASQQLGLLRLESGNGAARAHKDLLSGLTRAAPEWNTAVERLDRQADREYFSSSSEILSRSFEAHLVHARDGKQALGVAVGPDDVSYPNRKQARQQASLWSSWFASIKSLDLTAPAPAPVSTYTDFGQMLSSHRQGTALRAAAASQGVAVVAPPQMDDVATSPASGPRAPH